MELRNDFWAEELEIADDARNDWITRTYGNLAANAAKLTPRLRRSVSVRTGRCT